MLQHLPGRKLLSFILLYQCELHLYRHSCFTQMLLLYLWEPRTVPYIQIYILEWGIRKLCTSLPTFVDLNRKYEQEVYLFYNGGTVNVFNSQKAFINSCRVIKLNYVPCGPKSILCVDQNYKVGNLMTGRLKLKTRSLSLFELGFSQPWRYQTCKKTPPSSKTTFCLMSPLTLKSTRH